MLTTEDHQPIMPPADGATIRVQLDGMIDVLDRLANSAADAGDNLVLRLLAALHDAQKAAAEIETREQTTPPPVAAPRKASSKSHPVSHPDIAKCLSAQPHVWGLVAIYRSRGTATSTGGHMRRATYCGFIAYAPTGSYETRVNMVDEGWALEGRYVGQSKPDVNVSRETEESP